MPRAVAQWIDGPLVDALPRLIQPDQESLQNAPESRILQAMAGPAEEDVPHIVWEGLAYDVDLAAAERERIARVREQLDAPALGTAIASGEPGLLANALLALVYAPALGDPEGPALLSHDVAARHDFKTEGPAGSRRDVLPWLPPRDQLGDGMPWHVAGALLGLDLGLARLALRRIADNEMPVAPSINLNDELTLARTALAINPRDLQDRDRDRIVEAIARGRARVAAASNSLSAVRALAEEAQVSHAVRETLPWLVTRAPDTVPALFGLLDFVWLGHPELDHDTLDHWGSYSEPIDGRLRTAMPAAHPWDSFGGRADGGVMGALSPDLTLRMAVETARLKLPARLVPALLLFATQEYWHDVSARFSDDRPAMARQALALSPSRVEDYVAALAGNGPLRLRVK